VPCPAGVRRGPDHRGPLGRSSVFVAGRQAGLTRRNRSSGPSRWTLQEGDHGARVTCAAVYQAPEHLIHAGRAVQATHCSRRGRQACPVVVVTRPASPGSAARSPDGQLGADWHDGWPRRKPRNRR
jgi:hypothetical protein